MRPMAQRDPGLIATCTCGRFLPLARELLDQPGKLVACPGCGYEARVWQWAARANRKEEHGIG